MDKLKMQSMDVTKGNVAKIAALFPQCVTERIGKDGKVELAIDFEKLQAELSNYILAEGEERYQFTWPDKRAASRLANESTTMTLRPCREESVDFDTTENLYIEGDNLDVLKVLRETYLGKVKMIYIDPPYNTGNDFVYNDDFAQSKDDFEAASGLFDEEGNVTRNPMQRNTESNGRFHTDWLNMIYPRLKVARDLLSEDGVIFISIDDNEVDNLRKICDEIFADHNFVSQMIWEQGRKSMAAQIAVNHEYCLIYCKNKDFLIEYDKNNFNTNWRERKLGLETIYNEYDRLKSLYGNNYSLIEKGIRAFYKNLPDDNPAKRQSQYKCVDSRGLYFPGDIAQGTGNGGRFDIIHPITNKPCKLPKGGWRFGKDKLPILLRENRIHFGDDETKVPCLKRYLKETEYEVASSIFYKDGRGASKRLEALFGEVIFDFPKDEEIIKKFITLVTSYNKHNDVIVLDFFSGSATTAHAVMQLNIEDNGKRKFIMVQLPEITGDNNTYKNICEIGKERIRRAGRKIRDEYGLDAQNLDTGFRVLKLDSSNMEDVFYTPDKFEPTLLDGLIDNIKPDRSGEDLLFQVMLDLGIELSAKIERKEVAGKEVFSVDDDYLIACFDSDVDETVIEEMAKLLPTHLVIRDASASSDNVLDNFDQIVESYSNEKKINIHIL